MTNVVESSTDAAPESFAFPMSFAQRRLWLLDQLEGGSAFYNIPAALRLTGVLDIAALTHALNEIIARHEALRTNFTIDVDEPVQIVSTVAEADVPFIDLAAVPVPEREIRLANLMRETVERPFDLKSDLLVRVRLVRTAPDEHVLILCVHHIVADGWSVGVFVRELSVVYAAFSAGQPSPLPELDIQYADFSVWQHEWLSGGVLEEQLAYWRRQLAGAPELLALPTDRPRPDLQSYRGATLRIDIPAVTVQGLRALAQGTGTTLFMTLLAGFAIQLSRYAGSTDIVVGSPVANRNRAEIEPLIGFFVNSLVLRTDVSGDPTVAELLKRIKKTTLDAYSHQDVPFDQLVEALQPVRTLSFSPLFQVMLTLQNAPSEPFALPGLTLEGLDIERTATLYDLTLALSETPDGLNGTIEYNTDLFEPATIHRMIGHFGIVLAELAKSSERHIGDIDILSPNERAELLADWMKCREITASESVIGLIEAQVARTPEAPAVVGADVRLTYRELEMSANRLAHHLRAKGVQSGSLVGLCIERSPGAIVAILATLKAGAAYVVLDPEYPRERLALMLKGTNLELVLATARSADRIAPSDTRILVIDAEHEAIAAQASSAFDLPSYPDALVYGIFTSGSTGHPKLAGGTNRGIAALVRYFIETFDYRAGQSCLVMSSLSFDLTQKNIFAPLASGGIVHILPAGIYDPDDIVTTIARAKIDRINCTPSAFYPLLDVANDDYAALASLRHVFLGGEPIDAARCADWQDSPACRAAVVNSYGPTECSDVVSIHRMPADQRNGDVPIGRAVDHAGFLVLGADLALIPEESIGELCIAGDALGAGYLNDPALTAQRFVPDPYATQPGARMYRTGDLARRTDGGIHIYVGRVDQQVKLRGFRIELGDIEACLRAHPDVREAAAAVRDARLVAYIVPMTSSVWDTADLHDHAKTHLPDYMVPGAFVPIEALPFTPNGKLDRRALPQPDEAVLGGATKFVAPRTATEEALCAIWREVLGRDRIGIDDSFFELGGQSLLATQVIARARRIFSIDLPMRVVFECPTVAMLAGRITSAQSVDSDQAALEAALAEIEQMTDMGPENRVSGAR